MYRSILHRPLVSSLALNPSLIDAADITRLRIKTVPAILMRAEAFRTLQYANPSRLPSKKNTHATCLQAPTGHGLSEKNSGQDSGHACIYVCACVHDEGRLGLSQHGGTITIAVSGLRFFAIKGKLYSQNNKCTEESNYR